MEGKRGVRVSHRSSCFESEWVFCVGVRVLHRCWSWVFFCVVGYGSLESFWCGSLVLVFSVGVWCGCWGCSSVFIVCVFPRYLASSVFGVGVWSVTTPYTLRYGIEYIYIYSHVWITMYLYTISTNLFICSLR